MKLSRILNYILAALALGVVILNLLPYFTYVVEQVEQQVSIQGYIWSADKHAPLSDLFKEMLEMKKWSLTFDLVLMPIGVFVFSALSVVFCPLLAKKFPLIAVLPTATGVLGVISYLTNPLVSTVAARWYHLPFCAAMIVVGAYVIFVAWAKDAYAAAYAKKHKYDYLKNQA